MTRALGELWPDGPVELPALVDLGDERYRVRPVETRELLYALAAGDWTRLVPRAVRRRDRVRLAQRLYDPADALDLPHLWRAGTTLFGRLAGTSAGEGHDPAAAWWPGHRIAQFVVAHWLTFEGWSMRRGFNPHGEPLHRIVAAGWQFRIDHRPTDGAGEKAKPISIEALRDQVWTPPGPHRAQVMRFTASQERTAALAALTAVLPR